MLDEDEKRIKVLELKHQELMTHMSTLSWIIFTFLVGYFALHISNPERISALPALFILLSLIVTWFWMSYRCRVNAKNIRDQIFELEEEEMKEDKIKS